MAKCIQCASGFPELCVGDGTCDDSISLPYEEEASDAEAQATPTQKRVRRNKPDAAVKDQQSTGRKRAARLYPLHRDWPCEWRNKTGMGGGDNPIRGCDNGVQQARHHGPDKNTLNNEPGNVHRICHSCHNTWHAKNDPDYDPNKPLKH